MIADSLFLMVSVMVKGTLGPAPPAGLGMLKTGGPAADSFCTVEKSSSTVYVEEPAFTVTKKGSQRSAISPRFGGLPCQASGGPNTLADPTCASVIASAISWLETPVAICNVVPAPQPVWHPPLETSGKTP